MLGIFIGLVIDHFQVSRIIVCRNLPLPQILPAISHMKRQLRVPRQQLVTADEIVQGSVELTGTHMGQAGHIMSLGF